MKPYMRDYRVGEVPRPRVPLAWAVAASAAFPPFLSPFRLFLDPSAYTKPRDETLHRPPFTTRVVLSDGGVYDNLGLETAWKRYATILVADGGGRIHDAPRPRALWPLQTYRVLNVIDSQVRSLRKQQVIRSYIGHQRAGAYWGIRTDIRNYGLADALPCPAERTLRLAETATRLRALPSRVHEQLINWGYAVSDAALRRHVDTSLRAPAGFPYPEAEV